jgi:hypothetical protein
MKQVLLNRFIGIVCLLLAGGLLLVAQNDLRFGSSETENLYAILPSGIKAALHHQTASGDSGIVFSSQLGKNRLTFSAG